MHSLHSPLREDVVTEKKKPEKRAWSATGPGLPTRLKKDRRVKAATVDVDVVARRVILRRDRWEQVDAMTRALSTERGILASPAEVLAIVIDAGLGCVDSRGKPKPPPEATLKVSFASPADAERHDLVEAVNRLGRERDDLKALNEKHVQAEAELARQVYDAVSERDRAVDAHAKCFERGNAVDHDACSAAYADGREEDACLLCQADRGLAAELEENTRLRAEIEKLEDRPEKKEFDAAEKKAEELEEKLEKAEEEVRAADSARNEMEVEVNESVSDLQAVAAWAFGLGARFDEVYLLAAFDVGRAEIQKAWSAAVPTMPGECFKFKGGKPS
jgi:regulator of replication initiation timing